MSRAKTAVSQGINLTTGGGVACGGTGTKFTFAQWFKSGDVSGFAFPDFLLWELGAADFVVGIGLSNAGLFYANYRPGGFGQPEAAIITSQIYDDNKWHRYGYVKQADNAYRLWIDGKLAGTNATNITNSETFVRDAICNNENAQDETYLVGRSAIWNVALSFAQIESFLLYGEVIQTPHFWWECNDQGSIETDYSGNGRNGTVVGMEPSTDNPPYLKRGRNKRMLPTQYIRDDEGHFNELDIRNWI